MIRKRCIYIVVGNCFFSVSMEISSVKSNNSIRQARFVLTQSCSSGNSTSSLSVHIITRPPVFVVSAERVFPFLITLRNDHALAMKGRDHILQSGSFLE